ncbi:MAG: FAD:protein FMN transferase [Bacteroidales bacterium]|nr:FAD:protein FMN transferase [Bacteroidales bacterium]MCF8332861.1 FAD:protein FMN transferase [Bacteroidales bacterium]
MKKIAIISLMLMGLASCKGLFTSDPVRFKGEAQGTYYAITYYDDEQRDFSEEIDSLLTEFDKTASVYVPNSIISKVNKNKPYTLNEIFLDIYKKGMEVARQTDGKFDMTVMPLVNAWGFGFETRKKVDTATIDSIMQFVGYEKIQLQDGQLVKEDPRVQLDFNSIAQGYSVDWVADFLESKGIEDYLVDIGGEVYAKGKKPGAEFWRVGIEKPAKDKHAAREIKDVIALKDKAMATSGSYRKYYEKDGVKYSHTINPQTGFPVKHSMLSASVVADDAVTADAYATAFMVMGLEESKKFINKKPGLEGYFIYSDRDGKLKTYFTSRVRELLY